MASIQELLAWASDLLQPVSDSSRLDAEVLLAFCLDRNRAYLLAWPDRQPDVAQVSHFRQLVQHRLERQPIAYLTGSREFYSLPLKVSPATLVPRPETEMLVDTVLDLARGWQQPRVLDLGTGSGAIALAIKHNAPDCRVTATDVSADALAIARHNATTLGLDIEWLRSDWFAALDHGRRYHIIVSNPPYIAADDPYLKQGDLPAEPRSALVSQDQGLADIKKIIAVAPGFLEPNGYLVFEHGYQQGDAVVGQLRQAGFVDISCNTDFNGQQRMTLGRWLGTDDGQDIP